MENEISPNPPASGKKWLWVIVIIIIVLIGCGIYYGQWKISQDPGVVPTKTTNGTSEENVKENWVIGSQILKSDTTSSDTHKLADGTYRMYTMGQGGIVYADSTDAKTFGTGNPTGVREDAGKMISNPAVLEISSDNWIMIYEQAPTRTPGQQPGPPGPSTQRNLYLATSTDGKVFTPAGLAVDSSTDDSYFASVPDLVKISDSKIRMYYVCRGDSICSRVSEDNGKTWVKETGFRLSDQSVDPDVSYKDGKWVMYYSILDPQRNGIYKATSSDGLTWSNETKLFAATTSGAVVDPDLVEISPTSYIMFLGQSTSGGSTGGEQINLYRAELNKTIF